MTVLPPIPVRSLPVKQTGLSESFTNDSVFSCLHILNLKSTRPLKENQLVQDSTERAFLSYSRQKWIRAERKLNLGARVGIKIPASFCFSQQHNSSQDDAITPVTS